MPTSTFVLPPFVNGPHVAAFRSIVCLVRMSEVSIVVAAYSLAISNAQIGNVL